MVSSNFNADQERDLAARVKDLEAALTTMNDKAAADVKKKAGQPTVAVGGNLQYDTVAFGGKDLKNSGLNFLNGGEFRRLELQIVGEAFGNMDYKLDIGFANTARPSMEDVYFTIKELPYVQHVRIGHFKEPFGLEQLTSDKRSTFMERSMADGGFIVPGRNPGAMAFGWTENERATWAVGCFLTDAVATPVIYSNSVLPSGVTALDDKPQTSVTMRGTCLPWYDESQNTLGLWHLGGAYSYRATEGYRNGANPVVANYAIRPEVHLAPAILGTNALPAIDTQLMGLETALVYGPLSFQGEYFLDFIDRPGDRSNLTYTGVYGYVSYFLTGEHRPYNRRAGVFDRIRPHTNFWRLLTTDRHVDNGWGAWEVAYRCTYVDVLDDASRYAGNERTAGLGRAVDHTFGVNWYLNPYSRLMANYVLTAFDRVDTVGGPVVHGHTVNTFEMRAQFDF